VTPYDIEGTVAQFRVSAVLLDNDGTLTDSTAAILRCWRRWMYEYGITRELFDPIVAFGRPADETIATLLPRAQVARATRRYEELEHGDLACCLYPGAGELLAALPPDRWAIVTSASAPVAHGRLSCVGVVAPELVCADDVTRGKPDPEPYLRAAQRLGVAPRACLVLEDAPAGVAAAKAAGMATLAVTHTHPAPLLDADAVVSGLTGLLVEATGDGLVEVRVPTRLAAGALPAPA
jgi:mannitol-1-/sugar-/sorbitol-6-phosphatase